MSLATAIRTAQNSLLNTARQTIVTSRNIGEASNENYVRRDSVLVSGESGARVVDVRRNSNAELLRDSVIALSNSKAQSVVSYGADRLQRLVNGVDSSTAPATLIAAFEDALQLYSSDPSNTLLASATVYAAKEVVDGLNGASIAVQEYRRDVDQDIKNAVGELNDLLGQFKQANDEVVQGTRSGAEINDALDRRDTVLKKISEYVSVSVVRREGNDFALYTGQGVTLFETVPRSVTFEPLTSYSPGVPGNAIRIDGVPIIGGDGANTDSVGTLAAMVQMRDDISNDLQSQLDEIARGMIATFAESDMSGGGGPDLAGLFTHAGGPALPAAGTLSPGLALTIAINPAFDPAVGGNPELLRDGGANGAAYVSNTTGGSAFSGRLIDYVERMSDPMPTDIAAGIAGTYSVSGYAESSLGWLESVRKTAAEAADGKSALYERLQNALQSSTGVNIDEEMAILIDLEHAYQASSRIIRAVDEMLQALMAAVN